MSRFLLALRQHGEKLALGLALTLAVVTLVTSHRGDHARAVDDAVDEVGARIQRGVADPDAEGTPAADPRERLAAPWQPARVHAPPALPWAFYRKPEVQPTFVPRVPPLVHGAPTGLRVTASATGVELHWHTPSPTQHEGQHHAPRLIGYQLRRQRADAAPTVDHLGADAAAHTDRDTDPETHYRYALRAVYAPAPDGTPYTGATLGVVQGGPLNGREALFSDWTATVGATTPLDIDVELRSRLGDTATLIVWQTWKGATWRMVFKVRVGERVGRLVSPRELLRDAYNKAERADDPAYRELAALPAERARARSIPWDARLVFVGHVRHRGQDLALFERQGARLTGLGGLDWGTALVSRARD